MRGLDDYYSDDSDAFPDAEELAERVEQLEAENEALRGRIAHALASCDRWDQDYRDYYGGLPDAIAVVRTDLVRKALDGDA